MPFTRCAPPRRDWSRANHRRAAILNWASFQTPDDTEVVPPSRFLQNPCLQAWHGHLARVPWAGRPCHEGFCKSFNSKELEGRAPSRPDEDAKLRIANRRGYDASHASPGSP